MRAYSSPPAGPGNRNPQTRYSTRSKGVTGQATEAGPWFSDKAAKLTSPVKVHGNRVQALGMEGGKGTKCTQHTQNTGTHNVLQ